MSGQRGSWDSDLGSLQKRAERSYPLRQCLNFDWADRVLTVRAALGTLTTTFSGEYIFIGLVSLSPIFDLCIVGIVLDPYITPYTFNFEYFLFFRQDLTSSG